MCPGVPGTGAAASAGGAVAGAATFAYGAAAVASVWAGALAFVCAATAGVSPAAAKAIAHPISLIFTPGDVVGTGKRAKPLALGCAPYRRGFPEPQAPLLAPGRPGVEGAGRPA